MKKNKAMRTAGALAVATLLSTCMIGGTFAKYVTAATASDMARVAKFGVTATVTGSLYSDAYLKTTGNIPAEWSKTDTDQSLTVAAATENDNIVAPGTKSLENGLQFGLAGTPEVAVNVATEIISRDIVLKSGYTYGVMTQADVNADNFAGLKTGGKLYTYANNAYSPVVAADTYSSSATYYTLSDNTDALTTDYYPVVYTLSGTTIAFGTAKTVAAALAKAVNGGEDVTPTDDTSSTIESYSTSKAYSTNVNLASAGPMLGGEKITWAWDFDDGGAGTNDAKDTILGDLMAADANANFNTNSNVVAKIKDGASYAALVISDDVVKCGTVTVADLRTQFDITFTVTQID